MSDCALTNVNHWQRMTCWR